MGRFLFAVVFSMAFSMAFSLTAQAGTLDDILARKTLKVGVDVGYLPFEMYDFEGRIVGFDIDLANMLGEELGAKVEFVKTPFDQLINGLKDKKFDVILSGMSVTTSRSIHVNFSEPYVEVGQSLISNGKNPVKGDYKSLDKAGTSIYVQKGTTGHAYAKRNFISATVVPVQYIFEGANAAKTHAKAAFLYDEPFLRAYHGKYSSQVSFLGSKLTSEHLAAAVRKGDVDFLNVVNSFVQQIKGDGRLEQLKENYLSFKNAPQETVVDAAAAAADKKKEDALDRLERMERRLGGRSL